MRARSVAISEGKIVIGASYADVDGNSKAGKAYIYDIAGNLLTALQAPTPEENAEFGNAVAISGDTVVVGGEPNAKVDGKVKAGRAYVFGPGPEIEPGAETEPASVQEEAKPAAEDRKPSGGIPGFQYESIVLGLTVGVLVLWLLQRARNDHGF